MLYKHNRNALRFTSKEVHSTPVSYIAGTATTHIRIHIHIRSKTAPIPTTYVYVAKIVKIVHKYTCHRQQKQHLYATLCLKKYKCHTANRNKPPNPQYYTILHARQNREEVAQSIEKSDYILPFGPFALLLLESKENKR
jgi:hypothetical protein